MTWDQAWVRFQAGIDSLPGIEPGFFPRSIKGAWGMITRGAQGGAYG